PQPSLKNGALAACELAAAHVPRGWSRPGMAGPTRTRGVVALRGGDAVAAGNDLTARDLRITRNHGAEVLVGDPLLHEARGCLGLVAGLEETERAQDAVAGLDEVVAGKPGQLAKLRDEGLVDLAEDLGRAVRVDAFVTTNGGMHVMLLLWSYRAEALR